MPKTFGACLVLLLMCMSVHQAAAQSKLDRIFQSNMINAQVPYLESIAGPAMHVNPGPSGGQTREYLVNGCDVLADVSNKSGTAAVQSYALTLSSKCNFNLKNFGFSELSTRGLTISKVPFYQSLLFNSSCISMCGNAADPDVDFIQESSHATNWLAVVYTIVLAEMLAIRASENLNDLMVAHEGNDYVLNTKFNCDRKYGPVAANLFAHVPVNKVTVGAMIDDTGRKCQ
jgi:hypothetical protein